MKTTTVTYFSEGDTISALWRTPETDGPYPVIVQGPGWLGLKDAGLYVRYHEALTAAGFAVLIFDYRGFGDSGGDRGVLSPARQLQDLVNAVTYATTRDDVIADAIGTFGTGGRCRCSFSTPDDTGAEDDIDAFALGIKFPALFAQERDHIRK